MHLDAVHLDESWCQNASYRLATPSGLFICNPDNLTPPEELIVHDAMNCLLSPHKITTIRTDTSKPTSTVPHAQLERTKIAHARTVLINECVYDKGTGECYGTYIRRSYNPEPFQPVECTSIKSTRNHYTPNSSSTQQLEESAVLPRHLARVVEIFPQGLMDENRSSSTPGPKPQEIHNPLAGALSILRFEQRVTAWLDDITFGAIHMGPGVINGTQSVALSDVQRLLRLPVISTASAASCLLNHHLQPMCIRQVERVVQAARIALRGVALYLERHPSILESIDMSIDFSLLWKSDDNSEQHSCNEHPMKQQALAMIRSKVAVKTIAKRLSISKNTVKSWMRKPHKQPATIRKTGGVSEC